MILNNEKGHDVNAKIAQSLDELDRPLSYDEKTRGVIDDPRLGRMVALAKRVLTPHESHLKYFGVKNVPLTCTGEIELYAIYLGEKIFWCKDCGSQGVTNASRTPFLTPDVERAAWSWAYRAWLGLATAALLAIVGCAAPVLRGSVDAGYTLTASVRTPGGTDLGALDSATAPVLDRIVAEASACIGTPITGLRVKIAPDWLLNCDGTQQMLPTRALGSDPSKAFHGPACDTAEWHWRALYGPDGLIVSTPSLFDAKDPIIRIALGGMTPEELWANPRLAVCAEPSTGALDVF